MCGKRCRHPREKDGTHRSLYHDDPTGMFQFSLRLPALQHSGNSRWCQCVPCQHQAAHFHPNVPQEDREDGRQPFCRSRFGSSALGYSLQYHYFRICMSLVLRKWSMDLRSTGIYRMSFQHHESGNLLSPGSPRDSFLPADAVQAPLLLRFPDPLYLSGYRKAGKTANGSGEDFRGRLRILLR